MIAASHQPHYLLRLSLLMAFNSPIQEVAAKLSGANRQSSRTIDAIGPEVAPEPKSHECHSQSDQPSRKTRILWHRLRPRSRDLHALKVCHRQFQ